jgi:hypothetical protein
LLRRAECAVLAHADAMTEAVAGDREDAVRRNRHEVVSQRRGGLHDEPGGEPRDARDRDGHTRNCPLGAVQSGRLAIGRRGELHAVLPGLGTGL